MRLAIWAAVAVLLARPSFEECRSTSYTHLHALGENSFALHRVLRCRLVTCADLYQQGTTHLKKQMSASALANTLGAPARALNQAGAGRVRAAKRGAVPVRARASPDDESPVFRAWDQATNSNKRTDIKKIMILGAGPIVIGQACEFDYSGTQACKSLRDEGYEVILVNSNPATIMTDPEFAHRTYIEPITPEVVAKIIEKERPDALLPTMGGQTGLNTSLALEEMGVLDKFGVEMIGAKRPAIEMAEDRKLFREAMDRLGLENPKAVIANTMQECLDALEHVGPTHHSPRVHPRGFRWRHRVQHGGVQDHHHQWYQRLKHQPGAD